MGWDKETIILQDGRTVEAQAPVIVSASRSTDIPAFHSDWLMDSLKKGYLKWKNPFNGQHLYISFNHTRLIVFWTKNPQPIMPHLDYLDEKGIHYYFQFTLNDYEKEDLEPHVPALQSRIETFIHLSERIGKEKIIWRFDPLVLTDEIGVDELLQKAESIGNQLKNYTKKMVFSFADIQTYKKVQNRLKKNHIHYLEFDEKQMHEFATGISELNKNWNFELATCAEVIPLEQYGIIHNKCVDDDLMIRYFPHDKKLMDFLGVDTSPKNLFGNKPTVSQKKNNKDKGQRLLCGCIVSKDIGAYNTCPHLCKYCYANE